MTAPTGFLLAWAWAGEKGLADSIRHRRERPEGGQGWTDAQTVMSRIHLNLADTECAGDPRLLGCVRGLIIRVGRSAPDRLMVTARSQIFALDGAG